MKLAIPLGAILLIGIASSLLRNPISPVQPEGSFPVRTTVVGRSKEQPGTGQLRHEWVREPADLPRALPVPGSRKGSPAGGIRMLATLDRAVSLSSAQQAVFEQLLKERDAEIRLFMTSIQASGILDVREYDWRSDLMKESWYRRMDALLDGAQHGRFLALLEKGFLNEGLEITLEPGMTVLE